MRFIGLVGAKGSGKDTVGQMIIDADPSFKRVAFADVLKSMAVAIDPFVHIIPSQHSDATANWLLTGQTLEEYLATGALPIVRLSQFVEAVGWEEAKLGWDVRRFLQRLGTEGVRENLGADTWVHAAWDKYVWPHFIPGVPSMDLPSFVFTDVRFPNEIASIRSESGEIWRIERPEVEDGDPHASETAWREESWDQMIVNDHSIDDLRRKVHQALGHPLPL